MYTLPKKKWNWTELRPAASQPARRGRGGRRGALKSSLRQIHEFRGILRIPKGCLRLRSKLPCKCWGRWLRRRVESARCADTGGRIEGIYSYQLQGASTARRTATRRSQIPVAWRHHYKAGHRVTSHSETEHNIPWPFLSSFFLLLFVLSNKNCSNSGCHTRIRIHLRAATLPGTSAALFSSTKRAAVMAAQAKSQACNRLQVPPSGMVVADRHHWRCCSRGPVIASSPVTLLLACTLSKMWMCFSICRSNFIWFIPPVWM